MEKAEIYLVPGFLGFESVAELDYWEGVGPVLRRKLAARGVDATIHCTKTVPAGSFALRARKLAEQVIEAHDPECEAVHFLGHSTGGLDVRLLLSPGGIFDVDGAFPASLPSEKADRYLRALGRVRTAMSLATPHFGTPAADVLLRFGADRILRDATAIEESAIGRRLVGSGLALSSGLTSVLTAFGLAPGFLRWINAEILSRPPSHVLEYLHEIGEDIGALRALTQESMSLFHAVVRDRPGVDYVCFLTGTNRPRGAVGSADPFIVLNTLAFRLLWSKVARRNRTYPYAPNHLAAEARARLRECVEQGLDAGVLDIDESTSDGIVPTLSQIHGRIGLVVASDHLDCVGMFPRERPSDPYQSGWIRSGAHFREPRLELLYSGVADVVAAARDTRAAKAAKARPRAPEPA